MSKQDDKLQHQRHAPPSFASAFLAREVREGGGAGPHATNVDLGEPHHGDSREQQQQRRTDLGLRRSSLAPLSPRGSSQLGECTEEHHRLLQDDFTTDPIRKLIRHGSFPYKLVVTCLMLAFVILIAVLCHTPEAIASEEQRKAVLHSFAGDNYLGKDKGNIKLRPTLYLQKIDDVLNEIEGFVKVYYALSNASVSELNYYYYTGSEDTAAHLRQALGREAAGGSACPTATEDDASAAARLACVVPVTMEVDAYLYSQREYGGPAPLRHFTAQLTEANPLGPFSEDKAEATDKKVPKDEAAERRVDAPAAKSPDEDGLRAAAVKGNRYVRAVCAPRYDDLTGLYYSPCRRSLDASGEDKNDVFVFPLLDNVKRLRLKASMRHLTDALLNPQETVGGFSTVIYHWTIEKIFSFHPGGLVQVEFVVSVVTSRFHPGAYPRFFFTLMLLLLAVCDVFLRLKALRRIAVYRRKTAVSQDVTQEGENLGSFAHGDDAGASAQAAAHATTPDAPPRAQYDTAACRMPPTASTHPPQPQKTKLKRVKYIPKAGSLVPETVYTDFYDAWREQLQNSLGESWHYIALAADFFTLAYSIATSARLWGIPTPELYNTVEGILLGLTGLLLSVSVLSYLRYFPHMYFPVQAMRSVIPRLLVFAASVAPIFVGFAFFFSIVFGPHSDGEFADVGFSLVGLYFVMFGDAILPAIEDAQRSVHPIVTLLANVMTMLFILFFMMTMLNLAMAITQHEWGLLRRRFGSCLSANNLLFEVRTRDEVKAETLEVVIANMELLLHIKGEECVAAAAADRRHAAGDNEDRRDDDAAAGGVANTSRTVHEGGAELYRQRLNVLTEGELSGSA
ncbi:uncharacterized protein Tco025E_02921 [Trypanosoma conorhini]|uniref:Polycystin cation channel PKD1/PKD2 domain-containing protein n=1 Tax=Trypanosoma conorhini TaxID=83891 RepID=A0A3R7LG06_9TRYP|nr:uncharacterized protein Tco025E_02921 [Trypanosoma conorhini]RNF23010.1 hypothetical protein Tco025E_02921 [Trypanosoma conorhini]